MISHSTRMQNQILPRAEKIQGLTKCVLERLENEWKDGLALALIAGGGEEKTYSHITSCLERMTPEGSSIVAEYRKIDLAIINNNISGEQLDVQLALECKFNYSTHILEFQRRIDGARQQLGITQAKNARRYIST